MEVGALHVRKEPAAPCLSSALTLASVCARAQAINSQYFGWMFCGWHAADGSTDLDKHARFAQFAPKANIKCQKSPSLARAMHERVGLGSLND